MLISPPFLPIRNSTDETDSQWLDRAMFNLRNSGSYPVGHNLCWHGGVHLRAPWVEENRHLPVVAIADGTIVALKQPTAQSEDPNHVLRFDDGKWTSDGALVLKHETEIGATSSATEVPVRVTYYSVYQHLGEISAIARQRGVGGTLYRKEEIGRAGYIAGVPHLIHFEIACDNENLEKLIGRRTGNLDTSKNGRLDVVFGEIYFKIPKGTLIYEIPNNRRMRDKIDNNTPQMLALQPQPQTANTPPVPPITPETIQPAQIKKTAKECIIGLRYANGEGNSGHRGDLEVVTYIEDEANPGKYNEYGVVTRQQVSSTSTNRQNEPIDVFGYNETEYSFYFRVNEICKEWANNISAKPIPSGVLELLKFGRIINTAYHPNLAVTGQTIGDIATTPNWRKILVSAILASGQDQNVAQTYAWVNLNSPDIKVFSDADFPHWRGWHICDDDPSNDDSRCDSPSIRDALKRAATLYNENYARYRQQFPDCINSERDFMQATLGKKDPKQPGAFWMEMFFLTASQEAGKYMERSICTIPNEWNATNAAARWSWLKKKTEENPDPMTEEVFNKMTEFVRALSINTPSLDTATRRFHPRAFIEAFRKCLWFSAEELAQCIPRKVQNYSNNVPAGGTTSNSWSTVIPRSQNNYMALNRFFQKYCGYSRHRVIHNIAQILHETGCLRFTKEGGLGQGKAYDAFFGRGYHQLTWAGTYAAFGLWRKFPNHTGAYSDARIKHAVPAPNASPASVHYAQQPEKIPGTNPPQYPPPNFIWSPRFDPVLAETPYEGAESSGTFWLSKSFAGLKNLNRVCDLHLTQNGNALNLTDVYNVSYVSWCVNGGDNGHAERQGFTRYIANILMDNPYKTESEEEFFILHSIVSAATPPGGGKTFPPRYGSALSTSKRAKVHYVFQHP